MIEQHPSSISAFRLGRCFTRYGFRTASLWLPKASAMEFFTPNIAATPNSLGFALVLCSNTPLVLLDAKFVVRAASGTFCRAFGLDPDFVMGTELFALGAGEWNLPRLRSLLDATLSGDAAIDAYELDLVRDAVQHLILNVQRLDYAEADEVHLVLSVLDVTAARAAERHKDDLVREKQVLLKELQHRVANSLQIIASVLMQSARRVQSDEARNHLNDAHHRVLSIAMLQKQLAETTTGDVALRPYFTDLCRTIGASMIADPGRIRITPTISDKAATADESVSLGLIVTELIINALKHAFPDEVKSGNIAVNYFSDGSAWRLTVGDDGVGRPEKPVPGLGTGIVEALAKQLGATVEIRDAHPGTLVSVIHDETVAQ
jgi:two-component sensor histidine kinase